MTAATDIRRWKIRDELTREERRELHRAARGGRPIPVFPTDEWRAHVDALIADLAQRRDAAARALADAERESGIAALDGSSAKGVRQRIEDARSELQSLTAAETELKERDERDAKLHSDAEHRVRRAEAYKWISSYMTKAAAVLDARLAVLEAEADLRSIGRNELLVNMALGGTFPIEAEMDEQLIAQVGSGNRGSVQEMRVGTARYTNFVDIGSLTPERCAELREKAERLAAAEEVTG